MSSSYQGLPSLPRRLCWEPEQEIDAFTLVSYSYREYICQQPVSYRG